MARLKKPPQASDPGPDVSDPPGGFDLADLLAGRNRPGLSDQESDRRWLRARWQVLRIADERFDPRQILELSIAAAADWKEARLL